jgi:hypothetical protein
VFSHPEDLGELSFWVYMEASLHSLDWLNHCPVVINSVFSTLGGQRIHWSSKPLITWLVSMETVYLGYWGNNQKSPHQNKRCSCHYGNHKDHESSDSGSGIKEQILEKKILLSFLFARVLGAVCQKSGENYKSLCTLRDD